MELTMKKVIEATYLTADSASQYRTILRYFYHQHERMRDFITPEEILEHMRSIPAYSDYKEDTLHQQLAQLVKWNNLIARQDMTNAKTIEEYKKKRFRYQPTPYTIEIERMLVNLEKMTGDSFQGSLERTQFERLLQALIHFQNELSGNLTKDPEEYMRLWEDVFRYFQTIRTSTADYIAYINSEKADQRMQTEAFLVYKNQFTAYLRDFIVSLQKTSLQIQERLKEISAGPLDHFFQKLIIHRKSIPRLEDLSSSEEEWMVEYRELWSSLCQWFLGTENRQSELEILQLQTNEVIRRITRYVQRISERQQYFRSRRNDYLNLAKWFIECESLEEAHRLSSVAFGAITVKHLQFTEDTTDNMYAETWNEDPIMVNIKPRTNRYREKTKPTPAISNIEKIREERKRYLEKRRKEQLLLERYMQNGTIRLSELERVEPFIRKLFLTWIGKSMQSEDRIVKTDYGMKVRVIMDESRQIVLESEDGKLTMPDCKIERI